MQVWVHLWSMTYTLKHEQIQIRLCAYMHAGYRQKSFSYINRNSHVGVFKKISQTYILNDLYMHLHRWACRNIAKINAFT